MAQVGQEAAGMDGDELTIDRSIKSLRELTVEKLRDAILDFRFRPGERLVERTLCSRLGVSRSVVREALRHLESEGLVETIQHQGPVVARPDPAEAAQIYELRELLEADAAEACAERATPADAKWLAGLIDKIEVAFAADKPREVLKAVASFYEALFRIAGKTVAWGIVQTLNARINYLRAMTIAKPGRSTDALAEMRKLLAAIASNDPAAARLATHEHLKAVSSLAQAALSEVRH
jgi:DNA-binding GntR family transcriptional regulator